MIPQQFASLATRVQAFLEKESSGHDFYHAQRVFQNAMHLQAHEGGDKTVIGAAALVHDIMRPWEKKTGKSHFGKDALATIEQVLRSAHIEKEYVKPILDVVALHDIYDWTNKMKDKSLELQVMQDADNLDAIGAIGIGRTFAFGGVFERPMYVPGERLDFTKDFVEAPKNKTSTVAHFYEKLLKLKDNMNTRTGKRIAERRHAVMEKFLAQFFDEWEGRFE